MTDTRLSEAQECFGAARCLAEFARTSSDGDALDGAIIAAQSGLDYLSAVQRDWAEKKRTD